jgi:hypothetical protein
MIAVVLAALSVAGAQLPTIPPLPPSGWPSVGTAEAFARKLVAQVPPAALEATFAGDAQAMPGVLRNLGSALMTRDAALRAQLERYVMSVAAARAKRPGADVRMVVTLLLVDPIRYMQDGEFRARVTPLLPRALDATTPLSLRRAALAELNENIGISFDTAEAIGVGWKTISRASSAQRVAFTGLRMPDDLSGPIDASIYSLNSSFFSASDARTFLAAVRAAAPKRRLIVLADAPMKRALADLQVEAIDTYARPFTPWPRDPFSVARAKSGGIVFVNRPNLQPQREEDANMVRALVDGLATDARWSVAPVPFHNGLVLLTPQAAWISIHTVELRALSILGLQRVPVQTFNTAAGVTRYLDAAKQAGRELEALYGRPVRFVHALEASPALMQRLGGGAGFDLDSVMTLLPQKDGPLVALVGDLSLGAGVARGTAKADWTRVQRAYGITAASAQLAEAQSAPRAAGLQAFLGATAEHLAAHGVKVRRVPLLVVPPALASGIEREFLLTWNNVVLETRGGERRAEGFASLLPSGDAAARKAFTDSGYALSLFPPLARSVVLSGGYRCASNHVRP